MEQAESFFNILDCVAEPAQKALPGLEWVKIELSTEEEDADSVVEVRAKAAGVGLDRLDLRVESLAHRVGDGMAQVSDDVLKVPLQHLRHFDDGFEPAAAGPPKPARRRKGLGRLVDGRALLKNFRALPS